MNPRNIFVAGASGYVGRHLISFLLNRSHHIKALVRDHSGSKVPNHSHCETIIGNALDHSTFINSIAPCDTYIHLIGVAHPGPLKKKLFHSVDGVSIREAVRAAVKVQIQHFIYLSVAQGAPIMREYSAVRLKGETLIRESGLRASIFRPWYILGPAHRWPILLKPIYWLFEQLPFTREGAQRLSLISINEIVEAIVQAVEYPPEKVQILETAEIKKRALLLPAI